MAQSQKVSFNPGYKKPSFFKLVAQNKTLLLMCLPAVVFFFIFSYMPMPGAYIAFTNFQYNKGIWASPFVGLQNFKFLFTSGQLTLLLRNTILYNVAFIVLGNFLQLLFAILLNEVQSKRYKKTTQSMMFLPYFISDVLVSLLVYNLLNYDYGFISNLVRSMGGEMAKVYQMPNAWPFIIVLVNLWKGTGYGTVVYFAAITGMDSSMMEAAQIDGAGEWQIYRLICMPLCKGALCSAAILVFIDYWNMVEQPLILLSDAEMHPLSVFLSKINSGEIGLAFAVATIYMVPSLLVFLYGEEYLVDGITYQGGVKG